jgi:hypothetical protein
MATKFCEKCKLEHPGRECDYDPKTGLCAEQVEALQEVQLEVPVTPPVKKPSE